MFPRTRWNQGSQTATPTPPLFLPGLRGPAAGGGAFLFPIFLSFSEVRVTGSVTPAFVNASVVIHRPGHVRRAAARAESCSDRWRRTWRSAPPTS